ncbi:MAG: zinc ribbon domain-containing protein [Methanobrevibacter sp.]|nr:zinc ribbon domain-containing protein [Methanobrevibacter sp.]
MKKCPECGNPSYDGAPVCGNCGYKFPKPKVKAQKDEDIFQNEPISDKITGEDSTIDIIKQNKFLIGAIILITLVIIGIIIATGPSTQTTSSPIDGLNKYSDSNISFSYPSNWTNSSKIDELHEGAVFFEGSNGTVIEYYNVTSEFSSINEVNNQRISTAFENGDSINTIQPLQIDGKNASNVILANYDGTYTRYISILNNGNLLVFKITGNTLNSVTSDEIESVIQSAKIA